MSGKARNIFKSVDDINFMKAAEALRLVDIYSREIEIEETGVSLVRFRVCV